MKPKEPEWIEVTLEELDELLEATLSGPLSEDQHRKLEGLIALVIRLKQDLDNNDLTIRKLKELVYGPRTEKTRNVLDEATSPPPEGGDEVPKPEKEPKPPPPGHGRLGVKDYPNAEHVRVPHETLSPGDPCPECEGGKVYEQKPRVLIRFRGQPPLQATIFELDALRCHLCGKIFTASPPAEAQKPKHDAGAAAMVALLKYGSGLPFNRLDGLQRSLGVPLPASTQWQIVHAAAQKLEPVYEELIRLAAQGQILHSDDTWIRIRELSGLAPSSDAEETKPDEDEGLEHRTGAYTSGIVSVGEGRLIALFFTGRRHAGENLGRVLERRAQELGSPIQMCDGLARNVPGEFSLIVANCLAHGRRKFVEVFDHFPKDCRFVLETLREVYHHDALARQQGMSPEERLAFHQKESKPLMDKLKEWMDSQIEDKLIEPNSSLGKAIKYMRNRWDKLTRFLTTPGAPLDNNICERALKKAILHRKNALFFKTRRGARVADLFMSLIHTCQLARVGAFDYLKTLLDHPEEIAARPQDWMPWTYRAQAEPPPKPAIDLNQPSIFD